VLQAATDHAAISKNAATRTPFIDRAVLLRFQNGIGIGST
jgi:hypothetical protein